MLIFKWAVETTPEEFILERLDGNTFNVVAFTTNRVTGNMRVVDVLNKGQGIAFGAMTYCRPTLIGLDCADLQYSFKGIRSEPGEPIP